MNIRLFPPKGRLLIKDRLQLYQDYRSQRCRHLLGPDVYPGHALLARAMWAPLPCAQRLMDAQTVEHVACPSSSTDSWWLRDRAIS